MRLLFTLWLLQLSFNCFSQLKVDNFPVANNDTIFSCKRYRQPCGMARKYAANNDSGKTRIIIRCGSFSNNCDPLLVIDSVPMDYSKGISDIDPSIIDSLWVLKYPTTVTLYGSAGAHGVIIITTKKSKQRTFIIKDFTDGAVIAGATVAFISIDKKDTLMYASDDSGLVVTNKLKHGVTYQMNVSSINYNDFSRPYRSLYSTKQEEVLLERSIKTCEEVILGGIVISCGRTKCISWSCKVSCVTVTITNYDSIATGQSIAGIKIYPNPVQRGGTINLQLNNDGKNKTIRLLSLDGKQLMQKPLPTSKGNIIFPVSTDSRWASGIYFVQVICEKGRVLASEKIIIQ